jgi:tRNA nucleotidyltransferase/poly(A) polymerase
MLKKHSPFATNETHTYQNIYITSDEEIKDDEWHLHYYEGKPLIAKSHNGASEVINLKAKEFGYKKIIMTTDHDLIKDGVQAIDDEFLEWFVKNLSCEKVEIDFSLVSGTFKYKIIIPKEEPKYIEDKFEFESRIINEVWDRDEEPKQETLEESTKKYLKNCKEAIHDNIMFIQGSNFGAKWQAKRMYSEEDMKQFGLYLGDNFKKLKGKTIDEIFEQFKKK